MTAEIAPSATLPSSFFHFSRLMSALAIAQDEKGWLATETLDFVAQYLGMPAVAVYEVATFYHHFDVVKEGEAAPPKVTVRVCDTLSCLERMVDRADGEQRVNRQTFPGDMAVGQHQNHLA